MTSGMGVAESLANMMCFHRFWQSSGMFGVVAQEIGGGKLTSVLFGAAHITRWGRESERSDLLHLIDSEYPMSFLFIHQVQRVVITHTSQFVDSLFVSLRVLLEVCIGD